MYDYYKAETFKIENIEHDIHVLGVKVPAMPWCIYIFLAGLIINPFLAFAGTFIFIALVRKFYFAEKSGSPIEYHVWFIRMLLKLPWLRDLFPDLNHINLPEESYRA